MIQGYKNIFTAEPVQWAADYVLDILETLEEGVQDSKYGLDLLALEREELRGVWHELLSTHPSTEGPVFCASGIAGARLFVIRQLLAALPPVKPCPLHDCDEIFQMACRRLVNEFFILSQFRMSLEKKSPPSALVEKALQIVANRGVTDELLLNGHPLHIYCLDYELPEPACYFFLSHTILCGSSDFDAGRQLHCILHELGHVVYAAKQAGKIQPDRVLRKKAAEQFANRFAACHLTPV
jgi:hypothetical protein